ncbi:MAG: radical SAM protein [Desulfurococcaceae archaeon]
MIEELNFKNMLRKILENEIDSLNVEKALKNSLSRRKPRPCGFTIHTGIGCVFKCIYCYIEDMGFPWSIKKYSLNGYEIVYSLLSNPYFIPGEKGSLIAIGSVTEPFHPLTIDTTIDYIDKIAKYLKNPVQFSTKMYIDNNMAKLILDKDPGISPLITIVSLKKHRLLEPYAPTPEKRFESISNMRKNGLKPFLFLRPIIPGLIEEEFENIIDKSIEYGAVGIVTGSLRVTESILNKFIKTGIDVSELIKRLPKKPRGREQVSVYTSDIKEMIAKYARKHGLIFFTEACMANLYTHGYSCWKMIHLGYDTGVKPKQPSKSSVYEIASALNISVEDIKLSDYSIYLWISSGWNRSILLSELIHSRYRICVRILRV